MRIGLVFAKRPWPGFDAAVQEYRQIEAELVEQAGDDEFIVLETKRRIAEWILRSAARDDVPFEQFQEAWNGLLALGFTDDEKKRDMVFYYADYCLDNEHYDAGLAVIEPVIAEFEEWLQATVISPRMRKFYVADLENLKFRRDGLIALRAGGADADAWLERDAARGSSPEEERKGQLRSELFWAMKKISDVASDLSFAEIEQRYRQIEVDFLSRLQSDELLMRAEAKQRITIAIFDQARERRQPFETCRDLWHELGPWDFGHIEHKCTMIRHYAECCSLHGQSEAGLEVVEPLLAELQNQVDTGNDEDMPPAWYPKEIGRLENLRDELKAICR